MPTLFEELGGEPALRAIIDRFVDRIVADPMIGYLFNKTNRRRLKAKEYEHAAQHLGASVAYTGRPIDAVHAPHRILGAHFDRRVRLLQETLEELGAPERVREHFLSHTRSLRLQVITAGAECAPEPRPRDEP